MDWDDLRHFLAVARLGTLSKAAGLLQTTPATVARRVAHLEAALGTRLFERKYSGYRLTDSGRGLLAKAEAVEDATLSLQRATLGGEAQPAGRVRVTTTEDIGSLVIGPRLHTFAARYPDIQLDILTTREVLSLARGEAEIALRTVRPSRGGLTIRQAGWWHLGLYAAVSYAEAHDLHAPALDLSGTDIITWNEEYAGFRGGPWLQEHARNARIALTASSRRVHHAACKAGLGLAILPCLMADGDRDLLRLLPSERVIAAKLWIVVHRDLARVPRIRAVMDFLAEIGPRR
jgi:DNA-binding transcriptional LysR family regulator